MRGKAKLLVLFLIALVLASCQAAHSSEEPVFESEVSGVADEALAPAEPIDAGYDTSTFNTTQSNLPAAQDQSPERLIIRTGEMDIVVADTEETLDALNVLAQVLGGWVVSSNIFRAGDVGAMSGSVTVRIPAAEYDNYVAQARDLALEVRREFSTSQDVTEEYVDLTARLANLEATADRVRSFLDQAETVEEALAVNQELSRLEGEIEALKGRINYLEQSAAFSTLTIDLTPDELFQPIEIGGWEPQGVARNAIEALVVAFEALGTILIWGTIFCLPIGLLLGIPTWLLIRFSRGRWQRRNFNSQAEATE